ncbi:MAG: hypothetical protein AAGD14_15725 [Planctomycetota bacterium]
MKTLLKLVLFIVVLLAIAIGSSFWWLDGVAKKVIEEEGGNALGTQVKLEKLSIGILGGTAELGGLRIDNPSGYEKPFLFDLASGSTAVSLGTVMDQEIKIPTLELSGLTMYLEPNKSGKYNYQQILENIEKYGNKEKKETPEQTASEKTVVIERLVIRDVKVYYKTKAFITTPVHVKEIVKENIGSDGRGVDLGELISIILTGALNGVANELPGAISSGIKSGLKGLGDVGGVAVEGASKAIEDVSKKAGDEINKGVKKLFGGD